MYLKTIKITYLYLLGLILFCSCKKSSKESVALSINTKDSIEEKLHTKLSDLKNKYSNFNSPKAINHIAKIENNYFKDYSNYYGTVWRSFAEKTMLNDSLSYYDFYKTKLNKKADSLHCTLYAYEGLKKGLGNKRVDTLLKLHKKIWKEREIAGWSVGYILVKYFNWKAYHIVSKYAEEFKHCNTSFLRNKTYPVWRQPNILLEKQLLLEEDEAEITQLLSENEFGWGFSSQGIHTWITRFDVLKECYWGGAPSKKINLSDDKPLFINTPFLNYHDYSSHVIIYPPLLKDQIN